MGVKLVTSTGDSYPFPLASYTTPHRVPSHNCLLGSKVWPSHLPITLGYVSDDFVGHPLCRGFQMVQWSVSLSSWPGKGFSSTLSWEKFKRCCLHGLCLLGPRTTLVSSCHWGLNPYALRFLGLKCAAEGPSPNNCCHGYGFSIFMWRYLQALIIFDLWIPFSISLGYTVWKCLFGSHQPRKYLCPIEG